ncbi:MAG: hypothetical protein FJ388_16995, partial [Verrucomicrobia bacterium]|nr:hypothetical protein [Verrucomicrobiota bacterium]
MMSATIQQMGVKGAWREVSAEPERACSRMGCHLLAATLMWFAAGAGARAQDFNFTNQQSGLWSDIAVWVNGAASAPTNGGGTNYVINFTNLTGAMQFSTNDLGAGGLSNFFLNQLNFNNLGAGGVYLTASNGANSVSNFVFDLGVSVLPQINQNAWVTNVVGNNPGTNVGAPRFIFNTSVFVGGTGGGAPLGGSMLVLSNQISGAGGLIMTGAFTLRLATSNNYTGGTILSNGIIQIGNSNALGSPSGSYLIQVYSNAALELVGAAGNLAYSASQSKTVFISGMGLGPNTGIVFNSGGSISDRGLRNIQLGGDSAIGQDGGGRFDILGTLNGGGLTLHKVGNNSIFMGESGVITNLASVIINAGTFGLQGAPNLSSPNLTTLFHVYTGATFQLDGTLAYTNARGTIVMRGGAFQSAGGAVWWNSGVVLDGTSNFFDADTDMNVGGSISGAGALVKTGLRTLTLSGVNTYSGGTFITNGMVVFSSPGALPSTPAANAVTLAPGGGVAATGAYNSVMDWLNSGKITPGTGGFIAMATNNSEAIDLSAGGYSDMFLASMNESGPLTFTGTITPASTNYQLGGFGNLVLPSDNVLTNLYGDNANLIIGPAGVPLNPGYV